MAEREIGVGVIGYGLGGRVFHAPFVNAVNGLRLAAIMQRKGDEAARAWPATKIERSFTDTLADKSVEVVVVSTPNGDPLYSRPAGTRSGQARCHRQTFRGHQRPGPGTRPTRQESGAFIRNSLP